MDFFPPNYLRMKLERVVFWDRGSAEIPFLTLFGVFLYFFDYFDCLCMEVTIMRYAREGSMLGPGKRRDFIFDSFWSIFVFQISTACPWK